MKVSEAGMTKQQIKKTSQNAGETLVEVLVSMFLFLMMLGILQVAVSYSSASLVKNQKIRQENTVIMEKLQNASENVETTELLTFLPVNSDGTVNDPQAFQINTSLASKRVEYQDSEGQQQITVFYLYHTEKSGSED